MPPPDRYRKCACKHCGGHIEFPAEGAGRTIPCPHCNWPTELIDDTQVAASPAGRPRNKFAVPAAVLMIVMAAGAGVFFYMTRLRNIPAPPVAPGNGQPAVAAPAPHSNAPVAVAPKPPPDAWHGLMAGPIVLEKAGDGNLVYAVGKLRNASDHQRFGVKVELDVFNADRKKVGTATDYTPSIDPGKEWKFRAMVVDRSAKSAKLKSVKED